MGNGVNSAPNSAPNSSPGQGRIEGRKTSLPVRGAFSASRLSQDFEVDFDRVPDVGTVFQVDGLSFKLFETEPYTRKSDGQATTLLVWVGHCVDCGCEFTAKTGLRSKTITKRCDEHKAMGRPTTLAAQARLNASGVTWARYRQPSPTGEGHAIGTLCRAVADLSPAHRPGRRVIEAEAVFGKGER